MPCRIDKPGFSMCYETRRKKNPLLRFIGNDPSMNTIEYSGPERRTFIRVIYKPTQRAILKIASHEFEVLDVNESGIRFANPSDKTLATFVRGTLIMLNGDNLEIDGRIEWVRNPEIGISLSFVIPSEAIEKEQRYIILNCD